MIPIVYQYLKILPTIGFVSRVFLWPCQHHRIADRNFQLLRNLSTQAVAPNSFCVHSCRSAREIVTDKDTGARPNEPESPPREGGNLQVAGGGGLTPAFRQQSCESTRLRSLTCERSILRSMRCRVVPCMQLVRMVGESFAARLSFLSLIELHQCMPEHIVEQPTPLAALAP